MMGAARLVVFTEEEIDEEGTETNKITQVCDDLIDVEYRDYMSNLGKATQSDIKTIASEVAQERGIVLV